MINVAIDTGPTLSEHAVRGIGVNAKELIRELKKIKSDQVKIDVVDFEKTNLSGYDIVHYQDFKPYFLTLPSRKPAKKVIVTIHDLIPLLYPDHYPPGIKGRLRFLQQKKNLGYADAIITISETSKKDIVRFLKIDPKKVNVIYLAPKEIFKKYTNQKDLERIKRKYKLPDKFIFYLGDINYNKNIPTLVSVSEKAGLPLVIAGKNALNVENYGTSLSNIKGPSDWVRFLFNRDHPEIKHYRLLAKKFKDNKNILRLGFVPDEDLGILMNLAFCYCQTSFAEGFSLGVLEAMASGIPVVASDILVHRELYDDCCLFSGPSDINGYVKNIKSLENEKLRNDLINKGLKRAGEFSWRKTAEETFSVYKKLGLSL